MKWKFCEFCYINGHCENQDRGHKCECYGKKLEDKCERLEKQLAIAVEENKLLKCKLAIAIQTMDMETLKQIEELKQDDS